MWAWQLSPSHLQTHAISQGTPEMGSKPHYTYHAANVNVRSLATFLFIISHRFLFSSCSMSSLLNVLQMAFRYIDTNSHFYTTGCVLKTGFGVGEMGVGWECGGLRGHTLWTTMGNARAAHQAGLRRKTQLNLLYLRRDMDLCDTNALRLNVVSNARRNASYFVWRYRNILA